jgi:hypothetical protein
MENIISHSFHGNILSVRSLRYIAMVLITTLYAVLFWRTYQYYFCAGSVAIQFSKEEISKKALSLIEELGIPSAEGKTSVAANCNDLVDRRMGRLLVV